MKTPFFYYSISTCYHSITYVLCKLNLARNDGDKKNIRDRLKKLITRRPTIEELQKQGILKGSKKNIAL